MNGGIYLMQDNGQLIKMLEQRYGSERVLQELLAQHPDLLAGDQMSDGEPRRWLLISGEVGVPSDDSGANRWSLDHLFLDQDAIPTLVEVKRSSDTRARREVVGQMLEYAANAIVYWPVDEIRVRFEAHCEPQGADPERILRNRLGDEVDAAAFWQRVEDNLRTGKVRMIFVADHIPQELQRIVEFLYKQMNPAQVLAVEIKQYIGQGSQTLATGVVSPTLDAQQQKSAATREGTPWDEDAFFQELDARQDTVGSKVARRILEWSRSQELKIRWGRGKTDGAF